MRPCQWEDLTGVECREQASIVVQLGQKKDERRVELCATHVLEFRRDHEKGRDADRPVSFDR